MKKYKNIMCILLAICMLIQSPIEAFAGSTIVGYEFVTSAQKKTSTAVEKKGVSWIQGMTSDGSVVYYVKERTKKKKNKKTGKSKVVSKYQQLYTCDLETGKVSRLNYLDSYDKDGKAVYKDLKCLNHANDMCYASINGANYLFIVTWNDGLKNTSKYQTGIVRLKLESIENGTDKYGNVKYKKVVTEKVKIKIPVNASDDCKEYNHPGAITVYNMDNANNSLTFLIRNKNKLYTVDYSITETDKDGKPTAINNKKTSAMKYVGKLARGTKYKSYYTEGMEYDIASDTLYTPLWKKGTNKSVILTFKKLKDNINEYEAKNTEAKQRIFEYNKNKLYKMSNKKTTRFELESCAIVQRGNDKYIYFSADAVNKVKGKNDNKDLIGRTKVK